jgi:arginyl-tRNA synthetase
MESILHRIQREVRQSIQSVFPEITNSALQSDIAACAQEEFGHYQCNSAPRLAKILKMNPRDVAQKIVASLSDSLRTICSKTDIAGPGFINFTLTSAFLSNQLTEQLLDPKLGMPRLDKKTKVVIDFSSPNVAKELHVGHIRSTIIGDCLCRLFEFQGCEVLRLNHIGDWGTQFGMLITYMKEYAPDVLIGKVPTTLDSLMGWYKASKKRFDEDAAFQKRSQLQVIELQSGDAESLRSWQIICETSKKGFDEIYHLLNVKLIHRGESFYNPFLKNVIKELEDKGIVTISNGAKCIFLDGFKNREGEPLPLMVQKSDGGFNYDTTDMAAIQHRIFVEKADRLIYITDSGQSLHFQMIFAAAEKAGWLDRSKVQVDHIGFGLVLGQDGKKFKTRSGDTEKLIDLLLEGIDAARLVLQEKMPNSSAEEVEHLAKVIGIDAIKYSDLSTHRIKDYLFSYEKMLRFDGNTAVFLLYAYVRINGIKRKINANMVEIIKNHALNLQHTTEISLALHLRRFSEILESVAKDLLPNRLADYLYELAEKFNAFYRDCRIEGTLEESSRLILCEVTALTLKQGLEILGLETVERM